MGGKQPGQTRRRLGQGPGTGFLGDGAPIALPSQHEQGRAGQNAEQGAQQQGDGIGDGLCCGIDPPDRQLVKALLHAEGSSHQHQQGPCGHQGHIQGGGAGQDLRRRFRRALPAQGHQQHRRHHRRQGQQQGGGGAAGEEQQGLRVKADPPLPQAQAQPQDAPDESQPGQIYVLSHER